MREKNLRLAQVNVPQCQAVDGAHQSPCKAVGLWHLGGHGWSGGFLINCTHLLNSQNAYHPETSPLYPQQHLTPCLAHGGHSVNNCSLMFNLCWGLYIPLNFLPTLLRGASLENSLCKDGSPPVVTSARAQIGWSNFFALSLPVMKQKWACCLMSACLNCVLSNLPMCGYCGEGVADTHFQLLCESLHLGGDPEPASLLFLNVSRLSQKKSLIRSCLWG